jgi:hypothetical protein
MYHYPTTDIAMACFRTNEERPARVYGFDFGMDNPRNQDPRMPIHAGWLKNHVTSGQPPILIPEKQRQVKNGGTRFKGTHVIISVLGPNPPVQIRGASCGTGVYGR